MFNHRMFAIFLLPLMLTFLSCQNDTTGQTEITKWKDGKQSAVSLTFDDSSINQFRVALPLLNRHNMPGTFYVLTGAIPGSKYEAEFVGRPVEEIITETAETPTNEENLFERASAIRFSGYKGTYEYHTRAGRLFESGDVEEAYTVIDEGYRKIRNGEFEEAEGKGYDLYNVMAIGEPGTERITWDKLQTYTEQGHEIGSHTILHPFLAVLDSANIHHELVKSREDIRNHLGVEHTFSAECPYGTEDERVMDHAYELFPALRNRMPHPWLAELNRSSDENPQDPQEEYVQWQRGALSDTPMDTMKQWVDTSLEDDNIWLVLVFHGVEGIGWEPLTEEELREYYGYIGERKDDLWVGTFRDVTKYIRERMNAEVNSSYDGDQISIELTHSLDPRLYQYPLTLKTYVPSGWESAVVQQGEDQQQVEVREDEQGTYILYNALPNAGPVELSSS
ncbi:polysaccharide deacetylase family protein [Fodinibius sediminis]|uniref:Polysaccharide deacetylase n=1 Tax=Fodinibius sediminis TaxID=1214077 RepID=A0A521BJN1_9BACT|nr:polysaccharide deacetylase family protein [Fodinibius sediminis]SMO47292.1 Polysaccharide deacetylase [Fodinibius sediminis]